MSAVDSGSSVRLIFFAIGDGWWKGQEPFLNLVAAAAQLSSFTHVEIAIGEGGGSNGEMVNVLRVFNDSTGVVSYTHSLPLAALSLSSSETRSSLPSAGAGKPHGQEPQLPVFTDWMLAKGDAGDAQLGGAPGGQAVQFDGNGALNHLAAGDDG